MRNYLVTFYQQTQNGNPPVFSLEAVSSAWVNVDLIARSIDTGQGVRTEQALSIRALAQDVPAAAYRAGSCIEYDGQMHRIESIQRASPATALEYEILAERVK